MNTQQHRIEVLEETVSKLNELVATLMQPRHGSKTILAPNVFIDPTAVLLSGENASIIIGEHTKVWRGAEWLGPVRVGKRVFINQGSYIRPNVVIEDDVSLGPFVRLITDTHEISSGQRRTGTPRKDKIVIGRGTWIGAGATVMGGVTIGQRSIVAVGAVVNTDIPDNVVVAGVPARIIRRIVDNESGATLIPYESNADVGIQTESGDKSV